MLKDHNKSKIRKDKDGVYSSAEEFAKPQGGYHAFYKQIAEVMTYPAEARKAKIAGKVYVQFIVETDGRLTNLKVVKGIGYGCDEAALAALRTIPPFKPAHQDQKAVRQRLVLPITFRIANNSNGKRITQSKAGNTSNKSEEIVVVSNQLEEIVVVGY